MVYIIFPTTFSYSLVDLWGYYVGIVGTNNFEVKLYETQEY